LPRRFTAAAWAGSGEVGAHIALAGALCGNALGNTKPGSGGGGLFAPQATLLEVDADDGLRVVSRTVLGGVSDKPWGWAPRALCATGCTLLVGGDDGALRVLDRRLRGGRVGGGGGGGRSAQVRTLVWRE